MTSHDLVPVDALTRHVSGYDLYTALAVEGDIEDWLLGKAEAYGFVEGVDYFLLSSGCEVTLAMAQALALLTQTPRGLEVWRRLTSWEAEERDTLGIQSISAKPAYSVLWLVQKIRGTKTQRPIPKALKDYLYACYEATPACLRKDKTGENLDFIVTPVMALQLLEFLCKEEGQRYDAADKANRALGHPWEDVIRAYYAIKEEIRADEPAVGLLKQV